MTEQPYTHMGPPVPPPPRRSKAVWYKRSWVIAVAAGVVGTMLGAASSGASDVTHDPKYKAIASKLDDKADDLASAQDQLDAAGDEIDDLNTKVQTIAGDLPALQAQLKRDQAQLTKDQGALADKAADVAAADKSVTKREKAVGIIEDTIAANTIEGDGLFKVGDDMRAGTYKSSGSTGCYYAILNSTDTSDIADNNNIDGPAFVTLSEGQYFETERCADWVLQ